MLQNTVCIDTCQRGILHTLNTTRTCNFVSGSSVYVFLSGFLQIFHSILRKAYDHNMIYIVIRTLWDMIKHIFIFSSIHKLR
jgi:hypothetical protein